MMTSIGRLGSFAQSLAEDHGVSCLFESEQWLEDDTIRIVDELIGRLMGGKYS